MPVLMASIWPSWAAESRAPSRVAARDPNAVDPTNAITMARIAVAPAAIRMRAGVLVPRSDSSRDTLAGAAVVTIPKVLVPLPRLVADRSGA